MKTWNSPVVEELSVKATEYHPNGGSREDGVYKSYDGKYEIFTYGPSSDAGVPEVTVK